MVVKINYHSNKEIIEWQWASDNKLMPYPYWTSCYLVDGLLIDSGAPGGEKDLREFIRSLTPDKMIDKCFITHTHEDHAGGAHMLNKEFGIPIYTGEKAREILKRGRRYPDYRQIAWGIKLLPVNAKAINNQLITHSKKYAFDLFPMPGHAPELITLIEKQQQWAFVADAVQPKYKMIFGEKSDIPEDISLIYQSLQSLYNFTKGMDQLLIFSAGNGILDGRDFLMKKINEIQELHIKVYEQYKKLRNAGYSEKRIVRKILKRVFGKESIIEQMTRGALSKTNLIISLINWQIN